MYFLKNLINKFKDQRGEIVTTVALIGLGIVTLGIFVANRLVQTGPRDIPQAATDCTTSCTSWASKSCGGGTCANSLMYQTRTCSLSGCYLSRCVSNSQCGVAPTPWPANYCGTFGGYCSSQTCQYGEASQATQYCKDTYISTSKCCKQSGTAVNTPTRTRTPTPAGSCNQSCVSQNYQSGKCSDAIGPGCLLNPKGGFECARGACQCCNTISIPTRTPTPGAASNIKLPIGWHDGASGIQTTAGNCNASGWACDLDKPAQALKVHIYSGSTYLGQTTANLASEAAVNSNCGNTGNHRYAFALPSSIYGSTHSIIAYGINIDVNGNANGSNPKLLGTPKSITCNVSTPTNTPPACTLPPAPGGLLPASETTFSCTSNPKSPVTLKWNAVSGATSYYVRIDDTSDGSWLGACPNANPLDICSGNITGTSYSTHLFAGHNYKWWVSTFNACGQGVNSSINTFSIPPMCSGSTPTPTPLVCGGIQGKLCPTEHQCIYSNGSNKPPYPDAQGVCVPYTKITVTKTPTPGTTCSNACTAWQNATCGGGSCGNLQMHQTRSCTLSSCNIQRCTSSAQCSGATPTKTPTPTSGATCSNSCSAWQDAICGGGACGNLQMQQTRTCSLSTCNESRCVSHSFCTTAATPTPGTTCSNSCSVWQDTICGGGTCVNDLMEQTRTCSISGCTESRCASNSQCTQNPTLTPVVISPTTGVIPTPSPTPTNVPVISPTPSPTLNPNQAGVYFEPQDLSVPPSANIKIMVNSGNAGIAFSRVSFSFDPTLLRLTSEITTNPNMSNVAEKTLMTDANFSGTVTIVMGSSPSDTVPSGTFELASFSMDSLSTFSNPVDLPLTFDISGNQLVDDVGIEVPTVYTNGNVVAYGVSPTPVETMIVSFSPSVVSIPPGKKVSIMANSGSKKVAFAKIVVNFEPSYANLTSEITTNPNMSNVIEKTLMADANTSGNITIVIGSLPTDTVPSGTFEIASFNIDSVTQQPATSQIFFDRVSSQLVDELGPELIVNYSDATLNVNGAAPACNRGDLGNLDCSIDGCIDTADYELFRQDFGKLISDVIVSPGNSTPDLVSDSGGMIDTADYEILRSNFGLCQ